MSMNVAPNAIEVRRLEKVFTREDGTVVPVFRGFDLTVARGEFVVLLGPTGCGKTTLLRILLGLEPTTGGEIRVANAAVTPGGVTAGMVFQHNALLPWRRVLRNVTFPLELRGVRRGTARARARELLALVGLESSAHAFPFELSGGMQQRAAIARALAPDPEVLFLDEPFNALDDRTRRSLQQVLLDIWQERGMTVLFVTHNIEEALVLGDRILVLGRGRLQTDRRVALPRPRDPLSDAVTSHLLDLRRAFAAAVEPDAGEAATSP